MASNDKTTTAAPAGDDAAKQVAEDRQFDKLLERYRALEQQQSELADKIAALAQQQGAETPREAVQLKLVNDTVDPQIALAHLADAWMSNAPRPAPVEISTRTYRVTPKGAEGAGFPEAIVSNCLCPSDASSYYFRRVNKGNGFNVRMELVSQQRHAAPDTVPADSAGAVA